MAGNFCTIAKRLLASQGLCYSKLIRDNYNDILKDRNSVRRETVFTFVRFVLKQCVDIDYPGCKQVYGTSSCLSSINCTKYQFSFHVVLDKFIAESYHS
jgi:hypothetical protein